MDWYLPLRITSICNLDAQFFPFDVQMCSTKFSSWASDEDDVRFFIPESELGTDGYDAWEYQLRDTLLNRDNYPTKKFMEAPIIRTDQGF